MSEDPVLLSVAIDFGTTYSGYAFSTKGDFEKDPTKIYADEEWPAGNISFSRKTPTVLLLNPEQEFEAFGFEAEQMYYHLAAEMEHENYYFFRRFKMKLHGEKAGIDDRRLKIALEPEAAAFFCQFEKTERSENTFAAAELGTKYMVIDLGGGTVDIALHKKLENGRIQELYQASGGPYGGTAVDETYIQLLTRAFGGPMMYQFRKENTYDFLDMMKEFEVAKQNLKPSGPISFNTRLPLSFGICCNQQNDETLEEIVSADNFPFKGKIKVIGDKLSIKANMILETFSSVTTKITGVVQEVLSQIVADGCQILLLVGGFAESEFVQKAIKDKFETEERRVIVPAESGLTVVKGAKISGHRKDFGIVTERVIRYTYGIATDTKFDSTQHNEDYEVHARGKDYIHTFLPFMKKGHLSRKEQ